MRLTSVWFPAAVMAQVVLATSTTTAKAADVNNWYLLNPDEEMPKLADFQKGERLPIDCIQRKIDDGEHKFDEKKNIIFDSFPRCKETNDYLSFRYNVNEDFQCTIGLTDELFHLFQLYIHEDAPFSCRLPVVRNSRIKAHQEGHSVPLTFNFRGRIAEGHLDIDTNMNVLVQTPQQRNTIVSSIAWSAGTNLTRVIIGDYMTINFAVRWVNSIKPKNHAEEQYSLPFQDGFYALPKTVFYRLGTFFSLFGLAVAIISSTATYYVSYSLLIRKVRYFGFPVPGKYADGGEAGLSKND